MGKTPTKQTVILRASGKETPRRHATLFLNEGRHVLSLAGPSGAETAEDSFAWTAWNDPKRGWLSHFGALSPGFQGRRDFGASGAPFTTKREAVLAFNAIPQDKRTITIDAGGQGGQPVMLFIGDSPDSDNHGGLTIQISRA